MTPSTPAAVLVIDEYRIWAPSSNDGLHDVDLRESTDPEWLFHHLVERLDADLLVDDDLVRGRRGRVARGASAIGVDFHADTNGRHPDTPFGASSHLGGRYPALLADDP